MDNNKSGGVAIGVGIPSVVIGVLIALKKVGMTTMSYSDIIWFGIEVFIVCAAIGLLVWFIIMLFVALFGGFK
jgi:hypothetical protein